MQIHWVPGDMTSQNRACVESTGIQGSQNKGPILHPKIRGGEIWSVTRRAHNSEIDTSKLRISRGVRWCCNGDSRRVLLRTAGSKLFLALWNLPLHGHRSRALSLMPAVSQPSRQPHKCAIERFSAQLKGFRA